VVGSGAHRGHRTGGFRRQNEDGEVRHSPRGQPSPCQHHDLAHHVAKATVCTGIEPRRAAQSSFTSAMTIPAVTKTMIAICIQIQVGDTTATCR
jgi:hypothetical protein